MLAYGTYALKKPDEIEFVAVAEPNLERREQFRRLHHIPEEMCFSDWSELLDQPRIADAALICTQDTMHVEPSLKALEAGYHVMLEKPMAVEPELCIALGEQAQKYDRVFIICHVLRYTPFFKTIKGLLDDGRIGKLISIQHNENVGHLHQAHSYVRGNWRNSEQSSPMILAKSCHDMDIMLWLAGADCVKLSSFGSLTHFKEENAPEHAPARCMDGCPVQHECPYYAPAIYLTDNLSWPTNVISHDLTYEARVEALMNGLYGRCVYRCDNNVVDHQVVNMEFSNEVTAAFTMCAFTHEINRTLKLMGTKGEIRGNMNKNEIEVIDFSTGRKDRIELNDIHGSNGHGGGDEAIMREFVKLVSDDGDRAGLTTAHVSVQSHIMAFAAEKSRLEGSVIQLHEYMKELQGE